MRPLNLRLWIICLGFASVYCSKQKHKQLEQNQQSMLVSQGQLGIIDPEKVEVVSTQVSIKNQLFGKNFQTPVLTMSFKGNDFVQILRCDTSFRPTAVAKLGSGREEKKWMWYDAIGNIKHCRFAARRATSREFQDIAANNGHFFYIVNPCISQTLSQKGIEQCSFHLAVTESISFEQTMSAAFLEKAGELETAEDQFNQAILQLNYLSQRLLNISQQCTVDMEVHTEKQRIDAFKSQLAIVAGAVSMGALVMGSRVFLLKRQQKTYSNHEALGTAGFFSSALSLGLTLESLFHSYQFQSEACSQMRMVAAMITDFEEQGIIDRLQSQVVNTSIELESLNQEFEGYNKLIFDSKGQQSLTP